MTRAVPVRGVDVVTRAGALVIAALLTTTWPDGDVTYEAATTMDACLAAAEAAVKGIAVPEEHRGQRAVTAKCRRASAEEAGFEPGWDCIRGYNCETKR